jgi:hypothetical protein
MKPTMLMSVPGIDGACSYYRGIHPWAMLRKSVNLLVPGINFSESATWNAIDLCDILFMLRPFTDADVNIFNRAKRQGRPVIIDYDDDFFSIPKENPARNRYSHDDEHHRKHRAPS